MLNKLKFPRQPGNPPAFLEDFKAWIIACITTSTANESWDAAIPVISRNTAGIRIESVEPDPN